MEEASDGTEALEKAEKLQPDLVVLDIGLPKLNGIEVAKRLRQLAPQAIILFLSQEPSSDVVREALRMGALGYVHKARAGSELLPAIEAVLGGNRYVSRGLDGIEFGVGRNVQPPRNHEVLFSSDDELVLERFTHFVATALRAGNRPWFSPLSRTGKLCSRGSRGKEWKWMPRFSEGPTFHWMSQRPLMGSDCSRRSEV